MDLGLWTTSQADPVRRRRLAVGYSAGALGIAATLIFAALNAQAVVEQQVEETIVDVQLAEEPEPEPEPAPVQKVDEKPKPKLERIAEPVDVPDDAPAEAEPTDNVSGDVDPYASGQVQEPEKPAIVEIKPPKPKPVAAPRKKREILRVTDDVSAPEPLSMPMPAYPAQARSEGIEGVVVVKYIVNEAGVVSNAKVVNGPAVFHSTCIAAVRSWRFRPATRDGEPVPVVRMARFPFTLST